MVMQTIQADIEEFKLRLAGYIVAGTPVTVTRNGVPIGYFVPTPRAPQAHIAALEKASQSVNRLIDENGGAMEEIMAQFDAARSTANAEPGRN